MISFTGISTGKETCTGTKHIMLHAEVLEIPHFKTNFPRKTIRTTRPMKWNSPEKHISEAKTIKHFRNKIKNNI